MNTPLPPPPDCAASLYRGSVMHARLKGPLHRFTYKVFTLLIDIDRLEEAARQSALFSVGRFNIASFRPKDHGDGRGNLRRHIEALLAEAGHAAPPVRILLLCYPRVLGYVFNPISVYFCYDAANTVTALVYEVRNTFGEMHTYVAPVREGEASPGGIRQERDKLLYVSPFLGMAMHYRFRVLPPADTVRLRILEDDTDGPILSATFAGTQQPLTTPNLLSAVVALPLMTLKVVAGIHYEALKLWWKGARFHRRPPRPDTHSINRPGEWSEKRRSGTTPLT